MNFDDIRAVRLRAVELAMELNARREVVTGMMLSVADTFEKFINGGKASVDFHLTASAEESTPEVKH